MGFLYVFITKGEIESQIKDLYMSVSVDERLKSKNEGSTLLGYNGLRGGLEHLKII